MNKLKILTVHNRYLIRGGEDESVDLQHKMLQEYGHEAELFEYHNERVAELGLLRTATRTIWSREATHDIRRKLTDHHYDILDCQNTFPLFSPSIYYIARRLGVPVVQTLRNYRLLCPNALFFKESEICEHCLDKTIPWPSVVHRCYRDNYLASTTVAAMLTIHHLLKTYEKQVDLYVTLTEFSRQKFIQAGFPAERIVVKPNFLHPDPGVDGAAGDYALFVGRLTKEKGILTVLKAWAQLQEIPLKIVGEGPLTEEVATYAQTSPHVEYLGRKSSHEVHELMGSAKVLVFPSECYETFGRVALEAFAKGTPVIAAKIGAIAEVVADGRTGLYFTSGDAHDLATKVEWAFTHPEELLRMREAARAEYLAKYTVERNYQMLMEIYEQARELVKNRAVKRNVQVKTFLEG